MTKFAVYIPRELHRAIVKRTAGETENMSEWVERTLRRAIREEMIHYQAEQMAHESSDGNGSASANGSELSALAHV